MSQNSWGWIPARPSNGEEPIRYLWSSFRDRSRLVIGPTLPTDPADKFFRLVVRDVRVANQRGQVIHDISLADPLVAPVPWHPDVVDGTTVDHKRADPP